MDKDIAKVFLHLIQALAEGKTIQYHNTMNWYDILNVDFNHSVNKYRVKPEPRKHKYYIATWWSETGSHIDTCTVASDLERLHSCKRGYQLHEIIATEQLS